MTITLRCPPEFPVGLSRGALNGQAADATVVEQIERAIAHLAGVRRQSIPLWCHPRTIDTSANYVMRFRRPSWTAAATLRVIYDTITPWDWWTMSISIGSVSVALQPSPAYGSVSGAVEAALTFELGSGVSAAVADVDATLSFTWSRRDPALTGAFAKAATLYSASLAIEPMPEISQ
jgi:hypothetical protein